MKSVLKAFATVAVVLSAAVSWAEVNPTEEDRIVAEAFINAAEAGAEGITQEAINKATEGIDKSAVTAEGVGQVFVEKGLMDAAKASVFASNAAVQNFVDGHSERPLTNDDLQEVGSLVSPPEGSGFGEGIGGMNKYILIGGAVILLLLFL